MYQNMTQDTKVTIDKFLSPWRHLSCFLNHILAPIINTPWSNPLSLISENNYRSFGKWKTSQLMMIASQVAFLYSDLVICNPFVFSHAPAKSWVLGRLYYWFSSRTRKTRNQNQMSLLIQTIQKFGVSCFSKVNIIL